MSKFLLCYLERDCSRNKYLATVKFNQILSMLILLVEQKRWHANVHIVTLSSLLMLTQQLTLIVQDCYYQYQCLHEEFKLQDFNVVSALEEIK